MRSGTKNCLVSIYTLTESASPTTNAPIYTPSLWKQVWAHAVPRRGRELELDRQIAREIYQRFEFDYLDVDGITEGMYIEFEGAKYDIKGILPDLSTKDFTIVDAVARRPGTER